MLQFCAINDTRWHSSVYRSYIYVSHHLLDIIKWAQTEKQSKSVIGLLELVTSAEDIEELAEELRMYIETFSPVAEYLNSLADYGVRAWQVVDEEAHVVESLNDIKREPRPAWQIELVDEMLREISDYLPAGSCTDLFECARLCSPTHLNDTPAEKVYTAITMRHVTQLAIPDEEWEFYIQTARDTKVIRIDEMQDPTLWWKRRKESFPILFDAAIFLLRIPPVVTACDGVMSLDGAYFTPRQKRLDPKFAGKMLQWAANGDYLSRYGEEIRSKWYK